MLVPVSLGRLMQRIDFLSWQQFILTPFLPSPSLAALDAILSKENLSRVTVRNDMWGEIVWSVNKCSVSRIKRKLTRLASCREMKCWSVHHNVKSSVSTFATWSIPLADEGVFEFKIQIQAGMIMITMRKGKKKRGRNYQLILMTGSEYMVLSQVTEEWRPQDKWTQWGKYPEAGSNRRRLSDCSEREERE